MYRIFYSVATQERHKNCTARRMPVICNCVANEKFIIYLTLVYKSVDRFEPGSSHTTFHYRTYELQHTLQLGLLPLILIVIGTTNGAATLLQCEKCTKLDVFIGAAILVRFIVYLR
jgi:hypothetical protein